ncbi:MAG TPA: Ig-like domain-containing protein [Gemmatimonadales bacterium]|nr:Ig-like domain-containing protein [Gemmatimonadales bacterium]
MSRSMLHGSLFVLATVATIAVACTPDQAVTPGTKQVARKSEHFTSCPPGAPGKPTGDEGEIMGALYGSGVRDCTTGYTATLTPQGNVGYGVGGSNGYNDEVPYIGTFNRMWEFWDPRSGGACAGFTLTMASTDTEVTNHDPGASGFEHHCVLGGTYRFQGPGGRDFYVDYLAPVTGVTNTTDGDTDLVATFIQGSSGGYADLIIDVDLGTVAGGNTYSVEIQNAHDSASLGAKSFANQTTPVGTSADTFRFSVSKSTSSWQAASPDNGHALARLYFDVTNDLSVSTNYYDYLSASSGTGGGLIRLFRFPDPWPADTTKVYEVGLELLRPDDASPNNAPEGGLRDVTINTVHSVSSVSVTPTPDTISVSGNVALSVTVLDDASMNVTAYRPITWTNKHSGIASFNTSTLQATGVSAGVDTIVATSDHGVSDQAVIVVSSTPVVASVVVSPASETDTVGSTTNLSATAYDGGMSVMPGETFTWSSLNTGIATVNSSGVVTGVSAGIATIRATSTSNPSIHGDAIDTVTAPLNVTSFTMTSCTTASEFGHPSNLIGMTWTVTGDTTGVTWEIFGSLESSPPFSNDPGETDDTGRGDLSVTKILRNDVTGDDGVALYYWIRYGTRSWFPLDVSAYSGSSTILAYNPGLCTP